MKLKNDLQPANNYTCIVPFLDLAHIQLFKF